MDQFLIAPVTQGKLLTEYLLLFDPPVRGGTLFLLLDFVEIPFDRNLVQPVVTFNQ